MGWRFRKTVKIFPGLRLNISKNGISTSLGGKGATINLNGKGKRTTLGIQGTGVSHSSYEPYTNEFEETDYPLAKQSKKIGCLPVFGGLFLLGLLGQCLPKDTPPPTNSTAEINAKEALSEVTNESENSPAAIAKEVIAPVGSASATKFEYISVNNAPTYSEPNSEGASEKILHYRDPVRIVEKGVNWSKVMQNGVTFWVLTRQLTATTPPISSSHAKTPNGFRSTSAKTSKQSVADKREKAGARGGNGSCPCGSGRICTGSRGGRYCLTSSGNKDYGH